MGIVISGTSWFDNQHLVTEYTEEILQDVPCVPTGSNTKTSCELCKMRFEQFYYDESDEWLLRNAVKIDNIHYHTSCFQEHQVGRQVPIILKRNFSSMLHFFINVSFKQMSY